VGNKALSAGPRLFVPRFLHGLDKGRLFSFSISARPNISINQYVWRSILHCLSVNISTTHVVITLTHVIKITITVYNIFSEYYKPGYDLFEASRDLKLSRLSGNYIPIFLSNGKNVGKKIADDKNIVHSIIRKSLSGALA